MCCKAPGGKYAISISKSRKTKSRKIDFFDFEFLSDAFPAEHAHFFFSSLGSPVTLQKLQRTPQKCIFQRFLEMTETRGRKGGKKRKFDLGGVHRQKCQLESLEEGQ
jgi:hypothetical protein